MAEQSYNNHKRFYIPHHFVFYPLMLTFIGFGIYFMSKSDDKIIFGAIIIGFVMITCLSFMTRQHYALTLQDRVIQLEFEFRIFKLFGEKSNQYLKSLKSKQMFALRFASDEELENLILLTIEKNLHPQEIKKEIKNWRADNQRV